jgi:putative hemolysin
MYVIDSAVMELFILIGLIILNGVFAMSEIAIVTARKARLSKQAADGDKAAKTALKLAEDPTNFLSTVQIGITSIGILNGIFGEAILADPVSVWLQHFGLSVATSKVTAIVFVVVLVTYISIVVGELVPKRIGQLNAEVIAALVAQLQPFKLLLLNLAPRSHRHQALNNAVCHSHFHIRIIQCALAAHGMLGQRLRLPAVKAGGLRGKAGGAQTC